MTTRGPGSFALARSSLSDPAVRAGLVTPIALGLIGLTLAFRAWAVYRGGFFADDFIFLSDVARGEADGAWLVRRYNIQFMPLGFLLVLPVAHAGAFVWAAAATEIMLLQAASSLCCWIMVRTLFGNRPRILVSLTFYLFSAISMPSIMWWAASLNMLAVQPPLFLGIAAHVVYLRTGRKRFAVAAAACLVIALGFYLKALLLPVVLAIFTLTYFTSGPLVRRVFSSLRRWWLGWAMYGLIGIGFVAMYFSLGGSPIQRGGEVDLVDLTKHQVVASLVTGLLGGPWRWGRAGIENGPGQLADPTGLAQTGSVVLLVAVVVYLAARYRGALRPSWFILPTIVVTVGLLAAGPVAVFGTTISLEVRYWADTLPYFTLALGLMCLPLPGAADPMRPRDDPLIARRMPRRMLGGLTGAYVIGALVSSVTYSSSWHANYDARAFVDTAAGELRFQPEPVNLADETVPGGVMPSLTYPYNLTSRMLAPLNKDFRTPDIANDISVLNGFGQVVPGGAAPDLDVPQENLTACLITDADSPVATVELGARTLDFPFWASVTYRSLVTTDALVVAGTKRYSTTFLEGLHTLSFRTIGSFDTLEFSLAASTPVCLQSIHVGQRVVAR